MTDRSQTLVGVSHAVGDQSQQQRATVRPQPDDLGRLAALQSMGMIGIWANKIKPSQQFNLKWKTRSTNPQRATQH